MERDNIEFIDEDLRSLIRFEEVPEQKFDKELVKALMTLGMALISAIIGVRGLLWFLGSVLNCLG